MSKALFVAIDANPGHEAEVEVFLRDALATVSEEPDTRNWYALRFAAGQYAIFDTFPGVAAQLKHLVGKVGRALVAKSFTALEGLPGIESADLIAAKPPARTRLVTHALYVPMKARAGQEKAVADFLGSALPLVIDEPDTAAWYALDLGGGHFAIFDVFADAAARDAHLAGAVAAALMARAPELLEAMPEIRGAEVLAAKTWT
jgi:quinol monooxygenase YgiN